MLVYGEITISGINQTNCVVRHSGYEIIDPSKPCTVSYCNFVSNGKNDYLLVHKGNIQQSTHHLNIISTTVDSDGLISSMEDSKLTVNDCIIIDNKVTGKVFNVYSNGWMKVVNCYVNNQNKDYGKADVSSMSTRKFSINLQVYDFSFCFKFSKSSICHSFPSESKSNAYIVTAYIVRGKTCQQRKNLSTEAKEIFIIENIDF